jgi:phosphoketolase
VPANSHGTAKRKALAYCAKNNIAGAEFVSAMRMPTLDEQGVAEAETDYSKRRQREKDVDAGKPVAKQREPRMTDYQKRRAEQKRQEALGEDQDTSGVEQAIIRRIMVAHTDLLMKFGPDKVMQAAEEVAYNVGDVDEIGTSDVSAYVAQVKQILGAV